jgi:hypothetical protein
MSVLHFLQLDALCGFGIFGLTTKYSKKSTFLFVFLDKILESDDITEAKATETKKNLQATSEELPTTKSDEH